MKNSSDIIGNRTRDLTACSAVPQRVTFTAGTTAIGFPRLLRLKCLPLSLLLSTGSSVSLTSEIRASAELVCRIVRS